jgi:hypothetical protein
LLRGHHPVCKDAPQYCPSQTFQVSQSCCQHTVT